MYIWRCFNILLHLFPRKKRLCILSDEHTRYFKIQTCLMETSAADVPWLHNQSVCSDECSCFAAESCAALLCHRLTVKTHCCWYWQKSNPIFVKELWFFSFHRNAVIHVSSHWTNPWYHGIMCLKYSLFFYNVAVLCPFDECYNTSLSSLHVSIHSY